MRVLRTPRNFKGGLFAVIAAAALVIPIAGSGAAHAQVRDPEVPRASLEFRTIESLTIYAEADPASRVVTTLAPFSVVNILGQAPGKDGQVWLHIYNPGFEELGWAPAAKLSGAVPISFFDFGF